MRSAVVASLVGSMVVVGCVIAEAPADVPKLPEYRPSIVKGEVVPTSSRVLTTFPTKFIVPVELVDPTVQFLWRAYIDYDFAGRQDEPLGLVASGTSNSDVARSRTRYLQITIPPPADLRRCHVIQVVVANRFSATNLEGRGAHTPEPPGGDTIEWFYNPGGDLAGCPTQGPELLDAGALDAADGSSG